MSTEETRQEIPEVQESPWHEVAYTPNCFPIKQDDEYFADTFCSNGCNHLGRRTILIKKGVRRDSITDIKCNNCGCSCSVV